MTGPPFFLLATDAHKNIVLQGESGVPSISRDSVVSGDHCGAKRLDLAFGDKALRFICESRLKAQKQMGEEAAAALHARLADLEAADIITDISWVPMEIGATSVAIQFHPRYRLFVEANEAKPPKRGDVIDWNRVERLLIKRLDRT